MHIILVLCTCVAICTSFDLNSYTNTTLLEEKCVNPLLWDCFYVDTCPDPLLFDRHEESIIGDDINEVSSPSQPVESDFNFTAGSTLFALNPLFNLTLFLQDLDDMCWEDDSLSCSTPFDNVTTDELDATLQQAAVEETTGPFLSPLIEQSTDGFVEIDSMDNIFECLYPLHPIQENVKAVTSRINFASAKAGAVSISKSKGMSGAEAVLTSNKYKYSLSECKNEKWFVFSMGEIVMVDAIAIANYERFSSNIHEFAVYSSAVYPTSTWSFLGYFEAMDNSELQVFNVTTHVWSKFIRVNWLSHYRDESICAMSEFRVYGSSTMDTLLNAEFVVQENPASGLKEIITEAEDPSLESVNNDDLNVEAERLETKEPKSSSVPLAVSPEFKPLYDLYSHCHLEQTELAYSITVLHNRTKLKLSKMKVRVTTLEQEIQQLMTQSRLRDNDLVSLKSDIEQINSQLFGLQRSVHILKSWAFFMGLGLSIFLLYRRLRKMCREEREKELRKTVALLSKQLASLQDQFVILTDQHNQIKREVSPAGLSLSRQHSDSGSGEHEVQKKRSKRARFTSSRSRSLN